MDADRAARRKRTFSNRDVDPGVPPVSPSVHRGREGKWALAADVIFGRPENKKHGTGVPSGQDIGTITNRATRRWFEISVSAMFLLLAFLCFLQFRGYPPGSTNGVPMVVGPIILGLAGAVSGVFGRSPVMATVNFLVAFFLVPAYVILWEGYFF